MFKYYIRSESLHILKMALDSIISQSEPILKVPERRIVIVTPAISSIDIDGSKIKTRFSVRFNDKDVSLRGKSFMYFTALAVARVRNKEGWIKKRDIEPGENQTKYIYQLRNELKNISVDEDVETIVNYGHIIHNNGVCEYRLNVDPGIITFNESNLRTHFDYGVKRFFT